MLLYRVHPRTASITACILRLTDLDCVDGRFLGGGSRSGSLEVWLRGLLRSFDFRLQGGHQLRPHPSRFSESNLTVYAERSDATDHECQSDGHRSQGTPHLQQGQLLVAHLDKNWDFLGF